MTKKEISTEQAPAALGTYSQAIRCGDWLYISGQIALEPATSQHINSSREAEIARVFENLQAVVSAAGGDLSAVVKINIYLKDLEWFATVNQVMSEWFSKPYPARAAVEVSRLPKDVNIEIDAVAYLG